jgi:hypothetical protein
MLPPKAPDERMGRVPWPQAALPNPLFLSKWPAKSARLILPFQKVSSVVQPGTVAQFKHVLVSCLLFLSFVIELIHVQFAVVFAVKYRLSPS